MRVEVTARTELAFDDGTPVRAASAIAPFGDGWLIAQDDATHAAWLRPGGTTAVRAFPPVAGHDTFSASAGTKHLKPDVEAAVSIDGGVLLLGSGSTPARRRGSLLRPDGTAHPADLTALYGVVGAALGLTEEQLNLEGACLVDGRLRWFQRGNAAAGVDSASVDLDPAALLAAVHGTRDPGTVPVTAVRRYRLGTVAGVALAVTDAVALPDGRLLLSAAAEDTPNAYDDGPVVGAALVLVDAATVVATAPLPGPSPDKIEGLALVSADAQGAEVTAVVDADDADRPSTRVRLRLRW